MRKRVPIKRGDVQTGGLPLPLQHGHNRPPYVIFTTSPSSELTLHTQCQKYMRQKPLLPIRSSLQTSGRQMWLPILRVCAATSATTYRAQEAAYIFFAACIKDGKKDTCAARPAMSHGAYKPLATNCAFCASRTRSSPIIPRCLVVKCRRSSSRSATMASGTFK